MRNQFDNIFGVKAFSNPHIPRRPKIELSKAVDVSIEFRLEFNEWSKRMFGSVDTAYMFSPKHISHVRDRMESGLLADLFSAEPVVMVDTLTESHLLKVIRTSGLT